MNNREKNNLKEFFLFPIGKVKKVSGIFYLDIYNEYIPALKYLSLFSHIIIFYKNNNSFRDILKYKTVKIINLYEKQGIIEIDDFEYNETFLFDIKPHIPCEDRIKEIFEDNFFKKEKNILNFLDINEINKSIINKENNSYIVQKQGLIKKVEENYYLKMDNIEKFSNLLNNNISHLRVLWWFDKFDKTTYRKTLQVTPPYENAPKTGVFATRSPVRPNPIAMTTIKILDFNFQENLIKVSKMDCFDKTPIINIEAYNPNLERIKDFKVPQWISHWPEWLDDKEENFEIPDIIDSDLQKLNQYQLENKKNNYENNIFEEIQKDTNNFSENIILKGARQNNLKNISCEIPKNKMTVITGLSGSGKSSLAFDTIFAESQRRFMDSISNSGKSFFEQFEKPDFDQIKGLPPAVAIEQKNISRNPRSTVGTLTEIYDYLKLLFSKIGIRHCPECGRAVIKMTESEIKDFLSNLKLELSLKIQPFGNINTENFFDLKKDIDKCLSFGNGALSLIINETEEYVLQTKDMCYFCNKNFFELTTSVFCFNNPESMCPKCKGLGKKLEIDINLIISEQDKSILDSASPWWGDLRKHRKYPNANWMKGEILALANDMKVDLELPWKDLPEEFRKKALFGSKGEKFKFEYNTSNGRKGEIIRPVEGAYNYIKRLFDENTSSSASAIAKKFMLESTCDICNGERLSPEGRLVTIQNKRFPEIVSLTIRELKIWIEKLPSYFSEKELKISSKILIELNKKLKNLIDVGLSYLTINRPIPSLSGGEAQRLKLASLLGSEITNILYVFDEPSIGLHSKDHKNLIDLLIKLRDEGNTLLVVEHDYDTMVAADKIIDIGPGAGIHGGEIVAQGTFDEVIKNENSETSKYLKMMSVFNSNNEKKINRKTFDKTVKITNVSCNNLKNINVEIPLGVIVSVTGVSGSGKSSLITKSLYPAIDNYLNKKVDIYKNYDKIEGLENIDKIINISQNPIGKTSRSNPATYTGVFDDIRDIFAATEQSKIKKLNKSHFSFNSKDGQCQACNGEGGKSIQMYFMADVWVVCNTCHGKKFNPQTLEIFYKEKNIADVLNMNVEEALNFFGNNIKIRKKLQVLFDVGLSYIKLGQSALTLSGGEAQRVKLSKELSKTNTRKTLYLLDEPSTGLHYSDVKNLLKLLRKIVKSGNTVLIIEHNLDIIYNSDWIIDLGPDAGDEGGEIIAVGTPEDITKNNISYTGQSLKYRR